MKKRELFLFVLSLLLIAIFAHNLIVADRSSKASKPLLKNAQQIAKEDASSPENLDADSDE